MKKVCLFLCFFSQSCLAHMLHVGSQLVVLHDTKITSPALCINIGGKVVYAPMTAQNISGGVRIRKDGLVYSVCNGEKTQVGHYWFVGDCLIDVEDSVYLEGTGAQYIDTNYKPWAQNFGFYFDLVVYDKDELFSLAGAYDSWVGGAFSAGVGGNYARKVWGFDSMGCSNLGWRVPDGAVLHRGVCLQSGQRGHVLVINNDDYDGVKSTIAAQCDIQDTMVSEVTFSPDVQMKYSFVLYGINAAGNVSEFANARMYKVVLYEYLVPVRYFIPVPKGMQIGDYVVPSNGMWDVVEQRFYGNMGTGDFIYGVDN